MWDGIPAVCLNVCQHTADLVVCVSMSQSSSTTHYSSDPLDLKDHAASFLNFLPAVLLSEFTALQWELDPPSSLNLTTSVLASMKEGHALNS